ncbi:MAG: LysR family transcriptional regulator [Bacteroidales bacterium]|jgi:molybdate transport system regulatory protein|nr:LysR family transcriptional regulator [Bacteroidales bacterium]
MAGPKGSKYYDIFLNYKVWLETRSEEIVISAEGLDLLKQVAEVKSIVTAAKNMKISYRKAWGLLREVEDLIGFRLIEKHRGGASGGKTLLTKEGNALVEAYGDLNAEIDIALKDIARRFFRRINEIADTV